MFKIQTNKENELESWKTGVNNPYHPSELYQLEVKLLLHNLPERFKCTQAHKQPAICYINQSKTRNQNYLNHHHKPE
jgi:hypothetical protein